MTSVMTSKRQIVAELIMVVVFDVLPIAVVLLVLLLPVALLVTGQPSAWVVAGIIYGVGLLGMVVWWAIGQTDGRSDG